MLSKLDAVNLMLDAIGESPVNSLSSGLGDAENAERVLNQTSKDVQARGWYCNSERNVTLVRDATNKIPLPANCLKVDSTGEDKIREVVMREGYLYDLDNKTFVFDKNISCDIIYFLDWPQITYALQRYIVALASRKFQQISPTSASLDAMIEREVTEAWGQLLDEEAEIEDSNVLRDNAHSYAMTWRNNPRWSL